MLIAPYFLYDRHDVPHLAGVTLMRDGRELKGDKLSVYRLPGLQELSLSGHAFTPVPALLSTHNHALDRLLAAALDMPSDAQVTASGAGAASQGEEHG